MITKIFECFHVEEASIRKLAQKYCGLVAVAWVGVLVVAILIKRLLMLPIRVSLNYNEGWNAYHAAHAFGPQELYPSLESTISNNYPPLSFYIIGGLGKLIGDNLIAGRIIAFIALLSIAFCIGWLIYRRSKCLSISIFSGFLFLTVFGIEFQDYVSINDPQLLAHSAQFGALVCLLCNKKTDSSFVTGSLFMAVSLLIKHNLLALPAAVTIWLFIHKRRLCYLFVAVMTAILILSFLLFHVIYGPNFFVGLLKSPRTYSFTFGLLKLERWFSTQAWLVGIGIFVVAKRWQDPDVQLFGLYASFALGFGVLFAGGAGVNYNAVFDLTVALCCLTGLGLLALGTSLGHPARSPYAWQVSANQFLACVSLCLMFMLMLPSELKAVKNMVPYAREVASLASQDIALISSYGGQVICEDLAMCYFAGKPLAIDFFNFGQKLKAGTISENELISQIQNHDYSLLYLYENSTRLTKNVYKAIENSYEHSNLASSPNREFWLPREENAE